MSRPTKKKRIREPPGNSSKPTLHVINGRAVHGPVHDGRSKRKPPLRGTVENLHALIHTQEMILPKELDDLTLEYKKNAVRPVKEP